LAGPRLDAERSGRVAHFGRYLRGAVAVQIVRRLLKFWLEARGGVAGEHLFVKTISRFVQNEIFLGLDRDMIATVSREVVAATDSAYRPISPSTRTAVLKRYPRGIHCYLCQRELSATAGENDDAFLTLEHVWPSSMGGDSVVENLLPACVTCQAAKADAVSWEWFSAHNFVLKPKPSPQELGTVPRAAKIARHYMHAIDLSLERRLSLRDSLEYLGPYSLSVRAGHEFPVTFFDLLTTEP